MTVPNEHRSEPDCTSIFRFLARGGRECDRCGEDIRDGEYAGRVEPGLHTLPWAAGTFLCAACVDRIEEKARERAARVQRSKGVSQFWVDHATDMCSPEYRAAYETEVAAIATAVRDGARGEPMTDAELHAALREVVAIGRRGGYDNDEIAEKLATVVRDYAAESLRLIRELAEREERNGGLLDPHEVLTVLDQPRRRP